MKEIFEEKIQDIIDTSEIKTFGIIVYTDENPNIVKLLKDDDYWNALVSSSGKKFTLFAVKPKKGYAEFPKMQSNTMGFMQAIWKEPKDNLELLSILEVKSTQNLPLFFLFTKVGKYLLKNNISINDNDIGSALKQLQSIFYKIDKVIQSIKLMEEHPVQVHDKIAEVLKKDKFFKTVTSADAIYKFLKKYAIGF